ncbi:MAG: hypothetical protein N4A46_01135 [Schleiferiaceae bacterium]|jgi:hypothetical protein|nr:hypothetical protein [Schleiferiaceae bacterium]
MRTSLTLLFLFLIQLSWAQEEDPMKYRHFASVTFAYGIVPQGSDEDNIEKGHLVPALGADYLFRLAPKWEVGLMVDFELATYVIPRKENLKRERALLIVPVGVYNILPGWSAFGGAGIELEKHKNLPVFRLGTEYSFPIKNRWVIPVGIFMDVKEGYENFSFSVGIGRSF